MKRLFVFVMALLYFAVSSGFTVHVHYCMGHLVNATLVGEDGDDHNCTHCGMKKKKGGNGCCKDEHKIVKHATDHSLVKDVKLLAPAFFSLPAAPRLAVPAIALMETASANAFHAHGPPEPHSCPVYLSICNLRI